MKKVFATSATVPLRFNEMEKNHRCESLKLAEAWYEVVEGDFFLNLIRVATENDVQENHYLEEEGQVIEAVTIPVLYCPYCGERLEESGASLSPSFIHQDFLSNIESYNNQSLFNLTKELLHKGLRMR
ncbi:hypothetical protein [Marinospirillum insulare]|nr:hypothetical protein [Marinospirillum insulare]